MDACGSFETANDPNRKIQELAYNMSKYRTRCKGPDGGFGLKVDWYSGTPMRRSALVFCLVNAVLALACAGSPAPDTLAICATGERPIPDVVTDGDPELESQLGRSTQSDAANGGLLFAQECTKCHAPRVIERDSRLFRGYPRLDCSEYLAKVSDGYLHTVIEKGGEAVGLASAMKPFEGKLSADEIADLIAFIRSAEQTIAE